MKRVKAAAVLLVAAIVWLSLQASLLLRANGLLATYDLPAHQHLAAIQLRRPSGLWDDGWYAGHPTYSYPPLAHTLAAEFMKSFGFEAGFKAAVAVVYIASLAGFYVASRVVAGFPPSLAAGATLIMALSPLLFRTFLFGQYPSLVAFPLFWGVLAVFFAILRSDRQDLRLSLLGALLLGLLGSVHLYPLLLLPWAIVPLPILFPARHIVRRLVLVALVGGSLALLPSAALVVDRAQFAKTPVPHITRTAEMIRPEGMLDWVLAPAGLPMVLGILVIIPLLAGVRRGAWLGAFAAGLLIGYLRSAMTLPWALLALVYVVLLIAALGTPSQDGNQRRLGTYFCLVALASIWLALGPAGGLARLIPFADRLVFDRPLLFGAPFGYLALLHTLRMSVSSRNLKRLRVVAFVACGLVLLGFSLQRVLANYAIVPGAQGALPQGTVIPSPVQDFLKQERGFGRILPLGLAPIAYILPDLTGHPLIDGLYNDARQLAPLRRSALEALGYEKFTYPDLRYTRFFLANAEAYGIRWVVTGDQYYDQVVPSDRFLLVFESDTSPERSIRIYRSLIRPQPAWEGTIRHRTSTIATLGPRQVGAIAIGGGMQGVERIETGSELALIMHGSSAPGWAVTELRLPESARSCNQLAFQAWSPTGASLAIRIWQQGRWLTVRPEIPLPARPAPISLALDCRSSPRVQLAFTGSGSHRASVSAVQLREVRSLTTWVGFERIGPECFRVSIPHKDSLVTVSLAAFPRWRTLTSRAMVETGSDPLGLLTLRGPVGAHNVCVTFSPAFRILRTVVPNGYLVLSVLVLVVLVAFARGGVRGESGHVRGPARLRALCISAREILLRRRFPAARAWDLRAREAADWFVAYLPSQAESETAAVTDMEHVLDGVDLTRVRNGRVLEIGCGTGRLLKVLAPIVLEARGVDISPEMVRIAQEHLRGIGNVFVTQNDGETLLAFPDATFDFVFSFAVFQHIPTTAQIRSYAREIHRVLKPGGEVKIQFDGRGDSFIWRLVKLAIGSDSWSGVFLSRRQAEGFLLEQGFEVLGAVRLPGRGQWRLQGLWIHARKPDAPGVAGLDGPISLGRGPRLRS